MADKYDELMQLEVAYDALKTQPRDAQIRMLHYLGSRLDHEHEQAMEAKAIRLRAAVSASAPRSDG